MSIHIDGRGDHAFRDILRHFINGAGHRPLRQSKLIVRAHHEVSVIGDEEFQDALGGSIQRLLIGQRGDLAVLDRCTSHIRHQTERTDHISLIGQKVDVNREPAVYFGHKGCDRQDDRTVIYEHKVRAGLTGILKHCTVRPSSRVADDGVLTDLILQRVLIQPTPHFSGLVVVLLDRDVGRDQILCE